MNCGSLLGRLSVAIEPVPESSVSMHYQKLILETKNITTNYFLFLKLVSI